MLIRIVCPAPPGSLYGNRVTAERWARILRSLGHRVAIAPAYDDERCDVLVALHARRSAEAVFPYRRRFPEAPLIVALTGTDLYRDIRGSRRAKRALEAADRIVALQPLAVDELEPHLRGKLRIIYQSAKATHGQVRRSRAFFDVCVAGHLRAVKDPLRAAYAALKLPENSRIRILHAGVAMDATMARKAQAEETRNSRYRWLGPLSRAHTRRLIAQSRILVLSSRMEGGANVISEAVVDGTPVIASRIPGSVGLLGERYPGYFPVGDTAALARLLIRAESDSGFYRRLRSQMKRLAPLFRPAEESARWKELLAGLPGRQTRK
jgi:putative glycosyltransferase (TIGR04348 family)